MQEDSLAQGFGPDRRCGGIVGTTFRTFPSFPQRYIERVEHQRVCDADAEGVAVEPLQLMQQPTHYTDQDLQLRRFTKGTARRPLAA